MENRTGLFTNIVIWFGVAISVSEIEAGTQIASAAPLDSIWVPLILGHIVGGLLLFFVGFIGAKMRVNAMETITSTFGNTGSKFFASLNVLQLIAWVAVLNAQGAIALMGLNLGIPFPLICIILAVLIAVWVYIGIQRSSKLASAVMIILVFLLVILTAKLFGVTSANTASVLNTQTLTFWNIFEISIAMPISWLPVISDYTKDVEKPVKATAVSAIGYTVASLWMYYIGIETVYFGSSNISQAILLSGLGVQGVIILVLSTVTSNVIATNSAGESAKAIYDKIDPKLAGVCVSALSAVVAISGIMNHYIDFLYMISSVFAPMAAVLLVSYNFSHDKNDSKTYYWNLLSWFGGFIVYQITVNMDSVLLGPTLMSVIVSGALAYLWIILRNH